MIDAGYPVPTSANVSAVMRANRSRNTGPEVRLRSALHRLGLRFRVHAFVRTDAVVVRPDILFRKRRIAIFVDGCFWHSCPDHGNEPRVNTRYWGPKLQRVRDRDRRVDAALQCAGWRVVRIWEHAPVDRATSSVVTIINGGTPKSGSLALSG